MKTVLVPLAHGFEEIEAVAIVDILRRADLHVIVAGVGSAAVRGSHGLEIACDGLIDDVASGSVDAVALPGGMPGARNLDASAAVREHLSACAGRGGLLAAICAGPTVLNNTGLLAGRRATSHPNHREEMTDCDYRTDRVVVDGSVITSRGAGTAVEFAAAIVSALVSEDRARDILSAIQHPA